MNTPTQNILSAIEKLELCTLSELQKATALRTYDLIKALNMLYLENKIGAISESGKAFFIEKIDELQFYIVNSCV